MALLRPIFLDTSSLLEGIIDLGGRGEKAHRLMDAIADGKIRGVHTAWHCCLEFFAVSTALPYGLRITPQAAERLIEEEILARFDVHQLPEAARQPFLGQILHDRVMGGRIYDAHISEIARRCGAKTMVTENTGHFQSLVQHGIRVVSASELDL